MKFTVPLSNRATASVPRLGGKGANLIRLMRAGHRVPRGFVITTDALAAFLDENHLRTRVRAIIQATALRNLEATARASREIRMLFLSATMPPSIAQEIERQVRRLSTSAFAVRSSAAFEDGQNRSWAGQFDSLLNVPADGVLEAIKDCWASAFNARAMAYNPRYYRGRAEAERFAVIVQQLVPSAVAGVAFSVDPMAPRSGRIVIEAVRGLGDSLVSGRNCDLSALIDKKTRLVVGRTIRMAGPSPLSLTQLSEIARETASVEREFKHPVDVEWAVVLDKIYLLQARPITSTVEAKPASGGSAGHRMVLPIDDYELTFKVSGLDFLFADMLADGFHYLDPLFTRDERGEFSQYFSRAAMRHAARFGVIWYSNPKRIAAYETSFRRLHARTFARLMRTIESAPVTPTNVRDTFGAMSRMFTWYSRMDNQFTNAAYLYATERPSIASSLDRVARFKDEARGWINELAINPDSYFARYCRRLASELGLSEEEVASYSVIELCRAARGRRLNAATVRDRKIAYAIIDRRARRSFVSGREAVRAIRASCRQPVDGEIRGQVVNRVSSQLTGICTVVRVDYGSVEGIERAIAEMKRNTILVAEFTAPELLKACKKAKAIITDIGGLLSHAAIVSRELDIPCIVGTERATRVLRTGDRVRIDFDHGVVIKERGMPS